MNKVNFHYMIGECYHKVEEDIFNAIGQPLGKHSKSLKYKIGRANFSLFIRFPGDVLMSHGVADKNYLTMQDKNGNFLIGEFQHVLVPGPWMKKKLLNTPFFPLDADHIHIVGWPRLDALFQKNELLKNTTVTKTRPVVLWAPTHDYRKQGEEKESTSTFPAFQDYLPVLAREFDVRVSVHPRNRVNKETTKGDLLDADIVISDFGTMVYEAWALGKSVIFPRWILKDRIQKYIPGSAEAYIMEKKIGIHADSIEELMDAIRKGATDLQKKSVDEFMKDFLPAEYNGKSCETAARLLRELPVKTNWKHVHASNLVPDFILSARRKILKRLKKDNSSKGDND